MNDYQFFAEAEGTVSSDFVPSADETAKEEPKEQKNDGAAAETEKKAPPEAPKGGEKADAEKDRTKPLGRELLYAKANAIAKQRAEEKIIASWREEAEKLREIYPGFSLDEEMEKGGDFKTMLCAGLPLKIAFEAANFDKIIGSAMKYAAAAAGKRAALSIKESSSRVQENSVQSRASAVTRRDVNALTGKDIIKILEEVGKGAKISF